MQTQKVESLETAQFRAYAGDSQGLGATPGEALNDLMRHLNGAMPTPIVIWSYNRGDAYFTDAQQQRMNELKARRDSRTASEQAEWEELVEAAFDATIARTQAVSCCDGRRTVYLKGVVA